MKLGRRLDQQLDGFRGRRTLDENPGVAVLMMMAIISNMVFRLVREDPESKQTTPPAVLGKNVSNSVNKLLANSSSASAVIYSNPRTQQTALKPPKIKKQNPKNEKRNSNIASL